MREKLIELLNVYQDYGTKHTYGEWTEKVSSVSNEIIADNLIANGVIVPPCKVGDKVYIVAEVTNKIIDCTVIGVWICEGNCSIITDHGTIYSLSLGETVFLTREEAKAKLKGGVQE